MKKKTPVNRELKASTKLFRDILKRAAEPLSTDEVQKEERKKHGGYHVKRIRRRKVEDASD